MKGILKIKSVLLAVAVLVSCTNNDNPMKEYSENHGGKSNVLVNTEIVATFLSTKVSYAEEGSDLRPSWVVGDEIIALDEDGKNYKLTVTTVNEDMSAILSGEVPANCQLHLIYCPGVNASELTVDYTAQTGSQKTMPAVMLSDDEVKEGKGVFKFRNAGAIIGINRVTGPSGYLEPMGNNFIGTIIDKVTIDGENLSAATIALSGGALALTATEKVDDSIIATLSGITVKDANGTLSAPIFIAVPAGAKIKKVSASATLKPEIQKIPSTAADKEGVDYVSIEAKYDRTNLSTKKWAKWNVGASSEKDRGWYFFWAGTNGYALYAGSYTVPHDDTSIEYSYSPSTPQITCASDYLYVKKLEFSYNHYDIPYYAGTNKWTKYVHFASYEAWAGEGSCDNKVILDPEDDAACVNWGGTWRTPTSDEFRAMVGATYCAWDATDNGLYVFAPDAGHNAGTFARSIPEDLNKSNALLFFGAWGELCKSSYVYDLDDCIYLSSSVNPYPSIQCYVLRINKYGPIYFDSMFDRIYGCTVRPISD